MTETHPYQVAFDNFDDRIAPADREAFVAGRPHEDAVFDWEWWPRLRERPASVGWRIVYACERYGEDCPDAIGDMPISRGPDGHPTECPDCGGRVYRLARAWGVPMRESAHDARRAKGGQHDDRC